MVRPFAAPSLNAQMFCERQLSGARLRSPRPTGPCPPCYS